MRKYWRNTARTKLFTENSPHLTQSLVAWCSVGDYHLASPRCSFQEAIIGGVAGSSTTQDSVFMILSPVPYPQNASDS
ncbi:hypothetical protein GUJ93_ZPchr0002g25515 [Zizania palustris]|uniref:Uncharacterized protein n=1 Tax=Zizania palustris TaxID=103762 RepID=A0A8J5VAX7_ZIZPA|nr:hypothetical protein GUJ93_ZPchr0002g25515 [Zizania palustris]